MHRFVVASAAGVAATTVAGGAPGLKFVRPR